MEIIIGIILILFIYLFYTFNELMQLNLNIKEIFVKINEPIINKINLADKLEEVIKEDEAFKNILSKEEKYMKENENAEEETQNPKGDKEDFFQNELIEKHNLKSLKINGINILVNEKDKMKDMDVKEKTLNKIFEILINIDKEKKQIMKEKEGFNKLVNKYNKKIVKFPSKYIAKILGFTKYTNIK